MSPSQVYNPQGRTEVARLRKGIEDLFVRCGQVEEESEVVGDLNRYLCVRVAGFLEQSLMSVTRAHCEQLSYGNVKTFALSGLERSPNPRAEKVVALVRRFHADWGAELEEILGTDERGNRLDALVGLRNQIAHGKSQGVSRTQVWEYFQVASEVADWLVDKFEPQPR